MCRKVYVSPQKKHALTAAEAMVAAAEEVEGNTRRAAPPYTSKTNLFPLTPRSECASCKKPSWAGCGQHIETALSGVKEADRCPQWNKGGGACPAAPPAAAPAAPPAPAN